jgi:two-component system sensor histidine kinase/response regulator
MDGFAATRAIRALEATRGGHTPIVAVTAHAMEGDRQRCLAAGMDGYVCKPLRVESLFQAIAQLVPAPTTVRAEGQTAVPPALAGALDAVGGDVEMLVRVAGMFRDQGPRLLGQVRGALARGDGQAAAFAAHTLAGSLSVLAADKAREAARRVEHLAVADDQAGLAAVVEALDAELGVLISAVDRLVPPTLARSA